MVLQVQVLSVLLYNIVSRLKKSKVNPTNYGAIIRDFLYVEYAIEGYTEVTNHLDVEVITAFNNVYFPNKRPTKKDTKIVNLLMADVPDYNAIDLALSNFYNHIKPFII
jgi:hypothetical protein